jgi:hypothetical protein
VLKLHILTLHGSKFFDVRGKFSVRTEVKFILRTQFKVIILRYFLLT